MRAAMILTLIGGFTPVAVRAINMSFYDPQCGVDPAFGPFYERLLATTENPVSTSDFTNYFAPNGTMIIVGAVARGAEQILAARQSLLPVDGSVRWEHYPNTTFVASETAKSKTFQLAGILHTIIGDACSVTYFATRFEVSKNPRTGVTNLRPQSRSLLNYDGFSIEGSSDPCVLP